MYTLTSALSDIQTANAMYATAVYAKGESIETRREFRDQSVRYLRRARKQLDLSIRQIESLVVE